ncbi:MAG TPA: hypothetical protein VE870_04960 [Bacteroidales bacterium]|nr:hypothetical protein [Bacteroidales bacterium]
MTLIDWLGSAGVFLILLAYFLNIFNKMKKEGYPYILMNIAGAGLACLASILLKYLPFIILEAAWTLVSMAALVRLSLGSRSGSIER